MFLFAENMKRERDAWEKEAKKKGMKEGMKEGMKLVAQRMKEQGFEKKVIKSVTGLKLNEI